MFIEWSDVEDKRAPAGTGNGSCWTHLALFCDLQAFPQCKPEGNGSLVSCAMSGLCHSFFPLYRDCTSHLITVLKVEGRTYGFNSLLSFLPNVLSKDGNRHA